MYILGLSAYYHDSAVSLIKDDFIIAAVQEERFTRVKHDSSFPINSIKYCLEEAKINLSDVDHIVFYDKPFIKFERILETYLAFAPRGLRSFIISMPIWIKDKLFQKSLINKELVKHFGKNYDWKNKLLFSEHHMSHAASAFFPSPFNEAAILTMDGVGEWSTTSFAIGIGNNLNIKKEIHFPHSLGLLYSAFTYYLGFKVNSGEYKVMGLAPYGDPKYVDKIKKYLIDIKDDGSFFLDMKYFEYCTGLTMTSIHFHNLFGGKPRQPETDLSQKEMDLAASIQKVTEEIVIKIAKSIAKETGQKNLCLAGGVALNCVVNGALLRSNIFENIWIQPAAGDAGGSLGAALAVYYIMYDKKRSIRHEDTMQGSYLGPCYNESFITDQLKKEGAIFNELNDKELLSLLAIELSNGKAVGWMQGRMEFGPRSLGNRSIIADPRSISMQKILNLKVKYRESFRPFAPSILYDELFNWFELEEKSPYMLLVADIVKNKRKKMSENEKKLFGIDKLNIPKSQVPAITHVDYSSRVQTVHKETNSKYYNLIKKFYEITNCPILVNTSFNIRGEPIVCSPNDAFKCFMGTDLDILVVGNKIMHKSKQNVTLLNNYKDKYKLD